MNIINNRYKILRKISNLNHISTYLVSDIKHNFEFKLIHIFEKNINTISFLKKLEKNFLKYKNLNMEGLLQIFEFGLISEIDNKQNKKYMYFYTSEYVEESNKIISVLSQINEKEFLDIYIQILQVINYLHIKGYLYNNLSLSNIRILWSNKGPKVYLNDVVKSILIDNLLKEYENNLYFRSWELLKGESASFQSEIYVLGAIGIYMIIDRTIPVESVKKDYLNILKKYKRSKLIDYKFIDKFQNILFKMTCCDNNRYNSINEIIDDINRQFKCKVSKFNIKYIKLLNFKNDFIWKKEEVEKTLEFLKRDRTVVGIYGEEGIGKTKFLKEMGNIFNLNKFDVIEVYNSKNIQENELYDIKDFLKRIMKYCKKGLIDQYRKDLSEFIPELDNKIEVNLNNIYAEKQYLIGRLSNFINKGLLDKKVIFIVDNIHFSSKFFIDFMKYNLYKYNNYIGETCNLRFIFSFSNKKIMKKLLGLEFLTRMKNSSNCMGIKLRGLNKNEKKEFLEHIFGLETKYEDREIINKMICINEYVDNPKIIEEVIKEFVLKKYIFISNKGQWCLKEDKIYNYELKNTMKEILSNQLKIIDKTSLKILKYISASVNNTCSHEYLNTLIELKYKNIYSIINNLVSKGILQEYKNGTICIYDFSNKSLKKMVYESMSNKEKVLIHKRIGIYIENLNKGSIKEYDKLSFYFENGKEYKKTIKYSIMEANRFKKEGNINKEIFYIKKVEIIMKKIGESSRRRYFINSRLGALYYSNNDIKNALNSYEKALDIIKSFKDLRKQVDVLNSITLVLANIGEFSRAIKVLKTSEKVLSKLSYTRGKIRKIQIESNIYFLKGEHEKSQSILLKNKDLYLNNKKESLGNFYLILGNTSCSIGEYEKAFKYFKNAYSQYEKYNNKKNMAVILNNLSIIEIYKYYNYKQAKIYLERAREIYKDIQSIKECIYPMYNLADLYLKINDYEKSYNICKALLLKCKKNKLCREYALTINLLGYINYKLSNYRKAYKYFRIGKEKCLINETSNTLSYDFYEKTFYFFLRLKDYEMTLQHLKKAISLSKKIHNNINCNSLYCFKMLIKFEKFYFKSNSYEEINNRFNKLLYKSINKLEDKRTTRIILFELAFLIINDKKKLKKVWKEIKKNDIENLKNTLTAYKFYIHACVDKKKKLFYLNKALQVALKEKNTFILISIYGELGNYYFKKKDLYNAIDNYVCACNNLKIILKELPKDYRINFVVYNQLKRFIDKIYFISKCYLSNIKSFDIRYIENLEDVVFLKILKKLFENKNFLNNYIESYKIHMNCDIRSRSDIFIKISENSKVNLNNILKYLTSYCVATRGEIIIENNKKYEILASTQELYTFNNYYILNKCKLYKSCIMLSNSEIIKERLEELQNIEMAFCMPMTLYNNVSEEKINAYLYLESNKFFHNINKNSIEECKYFKQFLISLIQSYLIRLDSSIDKLTNALTRKFLDKTLRELVKEYKIDKKSFSIIMIDIDDFKIINDKFGHVVGDLVLKEVCKFINEKLSDTEILGRYGGEEFIIILPNKNINEGFEKAEEIRKYINCKNIEDNIKITLSLGVASYSNHSLTLEEFIEKADTALYYAKAKGKNKTVIWKKGLNKKMKSNNLSSILKEDNNVMYGYMPIFLECIELMNINKNREEKIKIFLNKIINIVDGEYIALFNVKNNILDKIPIFQKQNWKLGKNNSNNIKLINKVIKNKEGILLVDWDDDKENNPISNIPNWYSIIIYPLIKNEIIKGILYLKVSIKIKEFKKKDFNFIKIISQLLVNI